ncbi:MAG: glutamate racemase [Turicibacter sp.]|nr:glutamate racemase [Turicibacter sp.]
MKIGIMDSGIGGLTVLKECLAQIPEHEYLYYADSKNAPYGTKSSEEVYELTEAAVNFLLAEGADVVVLACNTATSAAARGLRQHCAAPIIGMEPAIKPALHAAKEKRVLVTATHLTLASKKFKELVAEMGVDHQIDCCPLTELVGYAEAGNFSDATIVPYLEEKLARFRLGDYASIVLGCTHFPLFYNQFRKVLPEEVQIFDGSHGTVNRVKAFITENSPTPSVKLFLSGEHLEQGELFDRIQSLLNK